MTDYEKDILFDDGEYFIYQKRNRKYVVRKWTAEQGGHSEKVAGDFDDYKDAFKELGKHSETGSVFSEFLSEDLKQSN